jgi:hypothetical protein
MIPSQLILSYVVNLENYFRPSRGTDSYILPVISRIWDKWAQLLKKYVFIYNL